MNTPIRAFFFAPDLPREQASARYKKLALALHPDTGTGDTVLMQQLNVEYEAFTTGRLLPATNGYAAPSPPPQADHGAQLREAAQAIIAALPSLSGVRFMFDSSANRVIAIGNTFPMKDEIRALGFRWDADRRVWWMGVIL